MCLSACEYVWLGGVCVVMRQDSLGMYGDLWWPMKGFIISSCLADWRSLIYTHTCNLVDNIASGSLLYE